MTDWRGFWSRIVDPYGHDRPPAENPQGRSIGNEAFGRASGNLYSPLTYRDNVALAGAPRLSVEQATIIDPPQVQQDGVGGPDETGPHDIIPNAPRPSDAELEAQAMRDAMATARASMQTEPVPYNTNARWVEERDAIERLRQRDRQAQAEMARREGVSFEDWWRFGGRQDEDWTMDQPAYRLSRLPDENRTASSRRRIGDARR